ncbi:hypothetical protein RND81_10G206800 [Saponaria officinalis]|uniref:Retrotransposon gag protein n=1 Tax=Saponaria officinalis TaxID=3572 RepID=A0AAW1I6X0_SAPOF
MKWLLDKPSLHSNLSLGGILSNYASKWASNLGVSSPKSTETSPKKNQTSTQVCVSVMTVGDLSIEDQILEMKKHLEKVMQDNEEKSKQNDELQKKVTELRNKEACNIYSETDTEDDEKKNNDAINAGDKPFKNIVGVYEKQLHEIIAGAVKSHLGGHSSNSLRYIKPYNKRIEGLRMPLGYQPPKFQQFDGTRNQKQHMAHFIETCSNAGTDGDLLVKQFVRSLKGITFDWYIVLDFEYIDRWSHMEEQFLNRFYSTRRIVSMSKLTTTTQWDEEPVLDNINRWCSPSLECKGRLSETSAVEMCINGMN